MLEVITSTCRICLLQCVPYISFFNTVNSRKYSCLLKEYTGIELIEKLHHPTGLCDFCLSELMTVIDFFTKIRLSCEKLSETLSWNLPVYFTDYIKLELSKVLIDNGELSKIKIENEDILDAHNCNKSEDVVCKSKIDYRNNSDKVENKSEKAVFKVRKKCNEKNKDYDKNRQKKNSTFEKYSCEVVNSKNYSLRTRTRLYNSEDFVKSEDTFYHLDNIIRSTLVPYNFNEEGIDTITSADPRCIILKKCTEKGLKKDVVKCLTCGLLSINRSAFIVHYRKHSGEKPHKCSHCEAGFTQIGTLNTHLRRRHLKEWKISRLQAKKLKCTQENNQKNVNKLVNNTFDTETRSERSFICSVCGKKYHRRSSLATHMRLHNADKQFQCPYCPQKFVQSGMRSLHVRVHHTGEKPFFCHICGKSFVASTALTKHLVSHSDERKFKCEFCDKAMKSKDNLKRHILVMHTPAKRKVCDICGATFALTYKLNHHIKTWHENKRSGDCSICKKSFNNIEKHMKRHSGDNPFGCHMCHKTFFKQKNLLEHVKKHQNENASFKCTYENCTSAFSKKCVLDFHVLKYHLKHTPHICRYCSRGFYRKRDLGKHMKSMHDVKLESYTISNDFPTADDIGGYCTTPL